MIVSTLLLVSILVVAWLTAAATAVRSVSRIWLRHWVEQQLRGSGTAALYLDRPHRMLLAAATAVSLTVFAAGVDIGMSNARYPLAILPTALAYAVLLLVVGQLVPRAIARHWATALIPVLLPPLQVVQLALSPVLRLVRGITGERAQQDARVPNSGDELLEELLREGELEGVGEHTEIAIISGVVKFGEKRAKDVMTPKAEIFAIDESLADAEIARRVAQAAYSRVPVYRGSLDQIIGMVHVFDVLKHTGTPHARIRPVAFASPTTSCKELLFSMMRERMHLAVVLDPSGATVGIVTLEDLIEELVGDIRDEHDEPGPAGGRPARTVGPVRSEVSTSDARP
jgi:magnesium and cobalt exporter, CNNM family